MDEQKSRFRPYQSHHPKDKKRETSQTCLVDSSAELNKLSVISKYYVSVQKYHIVLTRKNTMGVGKPV